MGREGNEEGEHLSLTTGEGWGGGGGGGGGWEWKRCSIHVCKCSSKHHLCLECMYTLCMYAHYVFMATSKE